MNLLQLHEPGQTPIPHQEDDNVAVGIDLGTTNSVVAYASEGKVEALKDIHGNTLIPSVVSYAGAAPRVGTEAHAQLMRGERQTIASVKRLLGAGTSQVKIGERELATVGISAEILKHARSIAERALGREVRQAVITVPAYFDDAARLATKDAARLAGLNVLRLVNEPTAAALAYGLDSGAEGIYAVYDLGGGTFDISLLRLEKGVFQVLATGGDAQLGGDDFDRLVADYIISPHPTSLPQAGKESVSFAAPGERINSALLAAARVAKERLTEEERIEVNGKTVTRLEFETMIAPLVEQTLRACAQALSDAGLTAKDVQGVVLVGGSTRVPLVRQKVEAFFGQPPLKDVNPDEVVAIGAALQATALTHGSDTLLLDVIPLSLGLETMGGLTEKLLLRNTPIPATVSQEFTTWQDGQQGMQIHVVQGEREMVSDNRSLARFELRGIPPLPAGVARIKVTFTVDADGLLTVSAEEVRTGVSQSVHVKPSYGLSSEDMEQMLRLSMEHAREDITERLLTEARIEAQRTVEELRSAMKADAALLSEMEEKQIARQLHYLNEAIKENDRDRIDVEVQQLAAIAAPFAQRRMDKAIASALQGARVEDIAQEIKGVSNA